MRGVNREKDQLFLAGVHLNKEAKGLSLPRHLFRKDAGELRAVDRLYNVEKGDRLLRLVGLEGTDEVELDIRVALFQRRPFAHRLLHAVLPEDPVAGFEEGQDRLGPMIFRYRNDRDVFWLSASLFSRRIEARANTGEIGDGIGRRCIRHEGRGS